MTERRCRLDELLAKKAACSGYEESQIDSGSRRSAALMESVGFIDSASKETSCRSEDRRASPPRSPRLSSLASRRCGPGRRRRNGCVCATAQVTVHAHQLTCDHIPCKAHATNARPRSPISLRLTPIGQEQRDRFRDRLRRTVGDDAAACGLQLFVKRERTGQHNGVAIRHCLYCGRSEALVRRRQDMDRRPPQRVILLRAAQHSLERDMLRDPKLCGTRGKSACLALFARADDPEIRAWIRLKDESESLDEEIDALLLGEPPQERRPLLSVARLPRRGQGSRHPTRRPIRKANPSLPPRIALSATPR